MEDPAQREFLEEEYRKLQERRIELVQEAFRRTREARSDKRHNIHMSY